MRSTLPALASVAALAVAACSGGAPATVPPSVTPPRATAIPSLSTRIEVQLNDAFQIVPASMSVPSGVPVTFVVTNDGVLDHEFYLGDEVAQAEHEAEMAAGGMAHDEPEGISVEPGETKELTFTFAEAGATLAGCHVAGHYAAGMKASIIVNP